MWKRPWNLSSHLQWKIRLEKGTSYSNPRALRSLRPATRLTQTAMERKTVQNIQSNNGDAQSNHRTPFRNELGVFDDLFTSEIRLVYSISPGLWSMYLKTEFITTFSCHTFIMKPFSSSLKLISPQLALINVTNPLSFLMTRMFVICGNWHVCKRLAQSWEQYKFIMETIIHCWW